MKARTDFPTAVKKFFEILKTGESFTQNKLVEKTDLNYRTVQKVVQHVQQVQERLKNNEIDISGSDNYKLIRMKEKSGLASFPKDIQKMIIKTVYYPTISDDEEILVYLLLKNAIKPHNSVTLNSGPVLKKLIDAEFVIPTKSNRYYLTKDGETTAIGALELYPEIKNIFQKSEGLSTPIKMISTKEQSDTREKLKDTRNNEPFQTIKQHPKKDTKDFADKLSKDIEKKIKSMFTDNSPKDIEKNMSLFADKLSKDIEKNMSLFADDSLNKISNSDRKRSTR